MHIHKVKIKNFRVLMNSELALEGNTTLIVYCPPILPPSINKALLLI